MILPPFLIFFLGALVALPLPDRIRKWLLLFLPVVGMLNLLAESGEGWQVMFLNYPLELVRIDRLSLLFGYLFHIAAFIALLYAWHVDDRTEQTAAVLYAGGALGAVFAGDLITLFLFWETMALTSVFLILARRTPRAVSTGLRYLLVQVLSGVLLFAGALIHYHTTGSLAFESMDLSTPGAIPIFLAFGIKCAFPLLHTWLTDAYPEATVSGTVFLSAFTTKVAVYALARGFAGTEILVYIGTVMTCFPIFYAVIENDLRRVLAYSMINQIGFMVCGIGIGTELAVNGAVAHAFNDVIFKGLLMMSMGAVLFRTGEMRGSELGGLYKSMPKTTLLCIIGAASISAFPLFSGFVSKSMVMVAVLEEGHTWVWLALLFASAGVFHHAGIKIPFFAFFAHDSGIRVGEAPQHMLLAMGIAATLSLAVGFFPGLLYDLLPYDLGYSPYDSTHVLAQLQLLFFSALAFTWLKLSGIYPPELCSVNLDVDWFYRRLAPAINSYLTSAATQLVERIRGRLPSSEQLLVRFERRALAAGRTWSIQTMIGAVMFALALLLLVYFSSNGFSNP